MRGPKTALWLILLLLALGIFIGAIAGGSLLAFGVAVLFGLAGVFLRLKEARDRAVGRS